MFGECDCCDEENEVISASLQEIIDTSFNPDIAKLQEFLTFFKNYHDPLIHDPDWYTKERLMDLFNNLPVNL